MTYECRGKWARGKGLFLHPYGGQKKVSFPHLPPHWHINRAGKKSFLLDPEQPLYKIFEANCPATEKHLLRSFIGSPY